ncbi:MAG TPA: septum formation initiator family protein [Acidimicrobiales bacterium]|nr:septum formation initiator family protein [Acidimicrobiales bacterium]
MSEGDDRRGRRQERAAGTRPRPRRIPGAPGAVLLVPTLTDVGEDPADRRRRRSTGVPAAVTPLPPRPGQGSTPRDLVAGDEGAPGAGRGRPPLEVAGGPGEGRRAWPGGAWRAPDLARLLPSDPEERAEQVARLRRVGVRVGAVAVALALVYTVFPVRMALDLRASEHRARERQAAFSREIDLLEDEARDLRTDERVEEEARSLGLVYPGEESYGIYPAPRSPAPRAPSTTATTSTTTPPG